MNLYHYIRFSGETFYKIILLTPYNKSYIVLPDFFISLKEVKEKIKKLNKI